MKIAVIGYSGAGKSTLARALGERYGIPVLHFDCVQFTPNWQERDPDRYGGRMYRKDGFGIYLVAAVEGPDEKEKEKISNGHQAIS